MNLSNKWGLAQNATVDRKVSTQHTRYGVHIKVVLAFEAVHKREARRKHSFKGLWLKGSSLKKGTDYSPSACSLPDNGSDFYGGKPARTLNKLDLSQLTSMRLLWARRACA